MEYYIAQVFGFFALIIVFMSYQTTKRKKFLTIQIIACIFYAIQYLFLKAYSGFGASFICAVKSGIFFNYEKKEKKIPIIVLVFLEIAFIVVGIFTFDGIYSLIPIFIHCIYTVGTWFKDLKITYTIAIGTAFLWIAYCLIVEAHVAIFANILELIASIRGLRKVALERKKEKC